MFFTGPITFNNKSFKKARIVFRNGFDYSQIQEKTIDFSRIINPKLGAIKNELVCYCDAIEIVQHVKIEVIEVPIIEIEVIVKKDEPEKVHPSFCPEEFKQAIETPVTFFHRKEKEELEYVKDRAEWAKRYGDERLCLAINLNYSCDEEYVAERLQLDHPEFELMDHTTFIYPLTYPSLDALEVEKKFKDKFKYDLGNIHIRIGAIEKHKNHAYKNKEVLVVFGYLHRFDIFAFTDSLIIEDEED